MIKNLVVVILGVACGFLTVFISPFFIGLVFRLLGIGGGLEGIPFLLLAYGILISLTVILGGILVLIKTKSWKLALIFSLTTGLTIGVIFQINKIKSETYMKQYNQSIVKELEDQGFDKKVYINIVSVKPVYENHKMSSILLIMNASSEMDGNFGVEGTYLYPSGKRSYTIETHLTPQSKSLVELSMPINELMQNERGETTIFIGVWKKIMMEGMATQPGVPVEITAPSEMVLVSSPKGGGGYIYKFPDFSWEN